MGNHPGKPLRPSYREHFRPLPPPQAPATDHVDAPLLSRTTSEALMASFDRVRSGSRDGLALKKWISAPLPSSAPEGEDLEGMGADRRTSMTISRMQSSSNSTGRAGGGAGSELEHGISRKSSADYASSCSSNARQKPKPIKMMTKVTHVTHVRARTNARRRSRAWCSLFVTRHSHAQIHMRVRRRRRSESRLNDATILRKNI
jgi:hypothetical protein